MNAAQMRTNDHMIRRTNNQLDHALVHPFHRRLTIGSKRETPNQQVTVMLPRLLLRHSTGCDLRLKIDAAGNSRIRHLTRLAADIRHSDQTFHRGSMRQHRLTVDIANRMDMRNICAQPAVGDDRAPLGSNTGMLQAITI